MVFDQRGNLFVRRQLVKLWTAMVAPQSSFSAVQNSRNGTNHPWRSSTDGRRLTNSSIPSQRVNSQLVHQPQK